MYTNITQLNRRFKEYTFTTGQHDLRLKRYNPGDGWTRYYIMRGSNTGGWDWTNTYSKPKTSREMYEFLGGLLTELRRQADLKQEEAP